MAGWLMPCSHNPSSLPSNRRDQRRQTPSPAQNALKGAQLLIHPFQASALTTGISSALQCLDPNGTQGWANAPNPLMPVGNMSFAHIEEHEAWLRLPHLSQTLLNPMQLRTKTPSVSSEVEVLKG